MQYKTITLHLLEQRPTLYRRLRRHRTLLPTLEGYARDLKARHEDWKGLLTQTQPDCDPTQIASEALEMALRELAACLPSESPTEDGGEPSLDEAMAFLSRPTPPA
jgi:hypothetical protein